jgi:hypothetical protein
LLAGVTAEGLAAHAANLNAIGTAFENAGLNAEETLMVAVQSLAAHGDLPENITAALIDNLGEAKAQDAIDRAWAHAEALAADAVRAAGLADADEATVNALAAHIDRNVSVVIDALRGRPAALNALVLEFAHGRAKASRQRRGY